MTSGIYILEFGPAAQKTYIGKSIDMIRRWKEHAEAMRKGSAPKKLQSAYVQFGFPEGRCLLECHPDHLDLMESVLMIKYQPELNTTPPISLDDRTINILWDNKHLLLKSTSNLLSEYIESTVDRETLKSDVNHLLKHRSKQEMSIDYDNRLRKAEGEVDYYKLQLESAYGTIRQYQQKEKEPWYKKLF